ncbi:MAG: PxxKW family cysteine-rich protein, partial [Pseudomonadota bacterium]
RTHMQCITVKPGIECTFMTKKGCGFNEGRCLPVVEQCSGCNRTKEYQDGTYCNIAPQPAIKWNKSACNFATHLERAKVEVTQKLNPLKASKRAAGKK